MKQSVLITGANGGLGQCLVNEFDSEGYHIIAQCRSHRLPLLETNEHVQILGDLRDLAIVTKLVDLSKELDVLINNAGVHLAKPFGEVTEDEIREIMEVNLVIPIVLMSKIWPQLRERKGMVININSLAGVAGGAWESIYCASKHGLTGFSKAVQLDAAHDGVRVLNVILGAMQTPMTDDRPDQRLLIDPVEVAYQIGNLVRSYASMRISDVTLVRKN